VNDEHKNKLTWNETMALKSAALVGMTWLADRRSKQANAAAALFKVER